MKNNKIAKTDTRPTLVTFLLDRSGSMNVCKNETISGFNEYIKELKDKANKDMRFTFVQFDSQSIDTLYNCDELKNVQSLTNETFVPRGWTPLYDSIGKIVREIEKLSNKYRIIFCTLTDGENNSSNEWTLDSIRKLIKEKEDNDKWTFAHIGVGINGWNAVKSYTAGTQSISNVMNISSDQTKHAYGSFAGATLRYASNKSDAVCSDFWNKDKKT